MSPTMPSASVPRHHALALVWPGLALLGVVGLTEPRRGSVDAAGLGFAAIAALGWGSYLVLTQQVGFRMTQTAFGTLMALEPAMGVLLGLLVLSQQPSGIAVIGIALVVLAGAGAQHGGRRAAPAAVPERRNVLVPLSAQEAT